MTIFGPDVSSYQAGLDLSQSNDVSFVIAKTTEGTYYTDTAYPGFRNQAARLDIPFIWYHFLTTEPAADQVRHTLTGVGDPHLPGMLDAEPSARGGAPSWSKIMDYATKALDEGLNLRLIYLPHWYWQELGSPDLTDLTRLGLHLVSSAYVDHGYPGAGGTGWKPYGGLTPLIWQYTDNQDSVDYNAYQGTVDELKSLLYKTSQGDDMAITFASGQLNSGTGATTILCPPPPNGANWSNVWVSLGSDFGDAHLRIAAHTHGTGWKVIGNFVVPSTGDRVNPFGGPAPTGLQKLSIVRTAGSENVPVGWLIEAQGR